MEELYRIIEDANNQLWEIKENCKHDEWFIGYDMWRIGCPETVRICSACHKQLAVATYEEKEKFRQEQVELYKLKKPYTGSWFKQ